MYRDAFPGRRRTQFSQQSVFLKVSDLPAKSAAIFSTGFLSVFFLRHGSP
jgi:hypothetical protein